jgi:NAD(P)-dependent dehydrogenase (short-subunit alcohol dehydrogenase family)
MRMAGWAGLLAAAAVAAWGVTGARRLRPADLRGQVVWITGGSRGLGLCIARELVRQGCKVALSARDEAELARARADLLAMRSDAEVLVVPLDVTLPAAVHTACAEITALFGRIDGLVAVAGLIQVGPLEAMTRQDYERAMDVNFWGVFDAVEAVRPQMRARGAGWICGIDSVGGRVAVPHLLPYHCAKFALRGLLEGLDAELAKDGIAVTTVLPGLMRTGSPVNAEFKGNHAREFAWFGTDDMLPGLSISAPAAARRVVAAIRAGEREVSLGLPAALGGLVHDVLPGATLAVLEVAGRLLPRHDGRPNAPRQGWALRDTAAAPLVTFIGDFGGRYNQVPPERR